MAYSNSKLIYSIRMAFVVLLLLNTLYSTACYPMPTSNASKRIYVVYTQKNCIACFYKLNEHLYAKYGHRQKVFHINYIFYNLNILSANTAIAKLNKSNVYKIVPFKRETQIDKMRSLLNENYISPYIIVDTNSVFRLIEYKDLFDNEGNIIDLAF
jgi:hypothetical protein